MDDNKLPSQFQIGDRVATFQNGVVTGVTFYKCKVVYEVEHVSDEQYDGEALHWTTSNDSINVTAEIVQRVVNN